MDSKDTDRCLFCHIEKEEYLLETEYSFAKLDGYPISEGHTLIISKEHYVNYFELPEFVQIDMMKLVSETKKLLDKKYATSQYNIGINCGQLAGQTINHVHIHLIPRREKDIHDPRGGIRWILPDKAKYWDE
jgi:diadenosine tetraphosphate (Ap4A) HIT family hydrolase